MKLTRREFLQQGIYGTLLLGASSIPEPMKAAINKEENRKRKIKAKRVLMIALDGIRVDGLEKAHTPNLDALLKNGAFSTKTRDVMPSVTLPNWTSILCGSGPEQHGVTDNEWKIDNHKLPGEITDDDGYYPSVFSIFKGNLPNAKTAFYYNWKPLFNPYNPKYIDEESFTNKDRYKENYDKAFNFLKKNADSPTIVFLYSVHTDHAGHRHKWMSPEYIRSIEEADVEIGKLLEKMRAEGIFDDTHFFFLTDHGGIGNGHGGVSKEEMIVPWGIVGPKIKKGIKITEANNTVNTATTILRLFDLEKEKPLCWTGKVPESIFK